MEDKEMEERKRWPSECRRSRAAERMEEIDGERGSDGEETSPSNSYSCRSPCTAGRSSATLSAGDAAVAVGIVLGLMLVVVVVVVVAGFVAVALEGAMVLLGGVVVVRRRNGKAGK